MFIRLGGGTSQGYNLLGASSSSPELEPSPMQYTAPLVVPELTSPYTATTVILHGHGELDKVAVVDTSVPSKLADDHIEIVAFFHGINFTDNYLRLGLIKNQDFPVIMGSECTGIVSRVGANVHDLQEGDRVLCLRMHAGHFRRLVQLPRKYCYPLADHIGLRNGVALGLDFVTAHYCLFELGHLRPGQIVFMTAIGGGVGTAVVQLARTVPNVTIMGTASGSKHEKLRALGVDHVLHYGQSSLIMHCPRKVDIIINSSGGSDIDLLLSHLKPFGRLINIGSNNSVKSARHVPMAVQKLKWDNKNIRTPIIVLGSFIISGLDIGYYLENHQSHVHAILKHVYELAGRKEVKPIIHTILPLTDAARGLNMLCDRENFGKVILHEI